VGLWISNPSFLGRDTFVKLLLHAIIANLLDSACWKGKYGFSINDQAWTWSDHGPNGPGPLWLWRSLIACNRTVQLYSVFLFFAMVAGSRWTRLPLASFFPVACACCFCCIAGLENMESDSEWIWTGFATDQNFTIQMLFLGHFGCCFSNFLSWSHLVYLDLPLCKLCRFLMNVMGRNLAFI
jgi:hypothetical protein